MDRAFINARVQDAGRWKHWAQNFGAVKRKIEMAGVKVLNAAPDSRITAFPRMDIDTALREFANG